MTSRDLTPLTWVGVAAATATGAVLACGLAVILIFLYRLLIPMAIPAAPGSQPTPTALLAPRPNVAPQSSAAGQPAWLPVDLPLPSQADPSTFVGRPSNFSFLTDGSYTATLEFYQVQLTEAGWEKIDYGTRIGRSGADLQYEKEGRRLTLRIASVANVGTLVEVQLVGSG